MAGFLVAVKRVWVFELHFLDFFKADQNFEQKVRVCTVKYYFLGVGVGDSFKDNLVVRI